MSSQPTAFGNRNAGSGGGIWLRLIGALGMTGLLLVFLVVTRWLDSDRMPDQSIRKMDTIEMNAVLAPPPPPEEVLVLTPPPPPPPPQRPELEVRIDSKVPPIPSSMETRLELSMQTAEFEWETEPAVVEAPRPRVVNTPPNRPSRPALPPRVKSVYSSGELDSKPRLLNRPTSTYPSALLRRGIREGKALLEVSVSTSGRVTVLKVLSVSEPEFAAMARSVASRARFTVPKKNGRPVTAIYNWPLIMRP